MKASLGPAEASGVVEMLMVVVGSGVETLDCTSHVFLVKGWGWTVDGSDHWLLIADIIGCAFRLSIHTSLLHSRTFEL